MGDVKIFLSHASEDKDSFVRPLAAALRQNFEVWYDEYELSIGDSLRQSIEKGLRDCDFGVVVLSHDFFSKKWPQAELDGLFQLERVGRKMILPIWHGVEEEDVRKYSPILASRLAASSESGVDKVVQDIERAIGIAQRATELSRPVSWKERLQAQSEEITIRRTAEGFIATQAAIDQGREFIQQTIAGLTSAVEESARDNPPLLLKVTESSDDSISVTALHQLLVGVRYNQTFYNSMRQAGLRLIFWKTHHAFDDSKDEKLLHLELDPAFGTDLRLAWVDQDHQFDSPEEVVNFVMENLSLFTDAELRRLHSPQKARTLRSRKPVIVIRD